MLVTQLKIVSFIGRPFEQLAVEIIEANLPQFVFMAKRSPKRCPAKFQLPASPFLPPLHPLVYLHLQGHKPFKHFQLVSN